MASILVATATPIFATLFGPQPALFGVPLSVLTFVIGIAGMVVAFILFRRAVAGEGEYRSFRATTRREASTTLLVWAMVIFGFAVLGVLGVVLFVQAG
jgi:hypothetical protein